MLQIFFGPGEPGFAEMSGALSIGSFFDSSAGLDFSMEAAVIFRSLKDIRFILFWVIRWNFPGLDLARILECVGCVDVY